MLNANSQFSKLREAIDEYEPSRERALVLTKIDEAELWLTRCMPAPEPLHPLPRRRARDVFND